jgi:hypothetical protein
VAHRKRAPRPRRFTRPGAEEIRAAALSAIRRRRGAFPSQGELLRAVRRHLHGEDPLAALGGRRLRHLLIATPGVHLDVLYAERPGRPRPSICPVCGGPLRPIGNRTLDGGSVTIGDRCPACGYWSHQRPRVPVRYSFRPS